MKSSEPFAIRPGFLEELAGSLDPATLAKFGDVERLMLKCHFERVRMSEYPPVTGNPDGERDCGDNICDVCGEPYIVHPPDWRVIGYGNVPFLSVLCDGRRVKL